MLDELINVSPDVPLAPPHGGPGGGSPLGGLARLRALVHPDTGLRCLCQLVKVSLHTYLCTSNGPPLAEEPELTPDGYADRHLDERLEHIARLIEPLADPGGAWPEFARVCTDWAEGDPQVFAARLGLTLLPPDDLVLVGWPGQFLQFAWTLTQASGDHPERMRAAELFCLVQYLARPIVNRSYEDFFTRRDLYAMPRVYRLAMHTPTNFSAWSTWFERWAGLPCECSDSGERFLAALRDSRFGRILHDLPTHAGAEPDPDGGVPVDQFWADFVQTWAGVLAVLPDRSRTQWRALMTESLGVADADWHEPAAFWMSLCTSPRFQSLPALDGVASQLRVLANFTRLLQTDPMADWEPMVKAWEGWLNIVSYEPDPLRRALSEAQIVRRDRPDQARVIGALGQSLLHVGRCREVIALVETLAAIAGGFGYLTGGDDLLSLLLLNLHVAALTRAGRRAEVVAVVADRLRVPVPSASDDHPSLDGRPSYKAFRVRPFNDSHNHQWAAEVVAEYACATRIQIGRRAAHAILCGWLSSLPARPDEQSCFHQQCRLVGVQTATLWDSSAEFARACVVAELAMALAGEDQAAAVMQLEAWVSTPVAPEVAGHPRALEGLRRLRLAARLMTDPAEGLSCELLRAWLPGADLAAAEDAGLCVHCRTSRALSGWLGGRMIDAKGDWDEYARTITAVHVWAANLRHHGVACCWDAQRGIFANSALAIRSILIEAVTDSLRRADQAAADDHAQALLQCDELFRNRELCDRLQTAYTSSAPVTRSHVAHIRDALANGLFAPEYIIPPTAVVIRIGYGGDGVLHWQALWRGRPGGAGLLAAGRGRPGAEGRLSRAASEFDVAVRLIWEAYEHPGQAVDVWAIGDPRLVTPMRRWARAGGGGAEEPVARTIEAVRGRMPDFAKLLEDMVNDPAGTWVGTWERIVPDPMPCDPLAREQARRQALDAATERFRVAVAAELDLSPLWEALPEARWKCVDLVWSVEGCGLLAAPLDLLRATRGVEVYRRVASTSVTASLTLRQLSESAGSGVPPRRTVVAVHLNESDRRRTRAPGRLMAEFERLGERHGWPVRSVDTTSSSDLAAASAEGVGFLGVLAHGFRGGGLSFSDGRWFGESITPGGIDLLALGSCSVGRLNEASGTRDVSGLAAAAAAAGVRAVVAAGCSVSDLETVELLCALFDEYAGGRPEPFRQARALNRARVRLGDRATVASERRVSDHVLGAFMIFNG